MRKIKYTNHKVKMILKKLKHLGTIEKHDYYIKFFAKDIESLSEAKKFLDANIKDSDALGFQTDYEGKMQTISIFTDSI